MSDGHAERRRVPAGVTLLVGGARSGKSALAVELGLAWAGPVTFVATAEALDDDMARRIERHRAERPAWHTVEESLDLTAALATLPHDHLAIVDCLTLWVSNLLLAGADEQTLVDRAGDAAECAAARPSPTVVITNEVGLGIVPANDLARRYQDVLGRVNGCWARVAARSLLLVAGRAVALRDPWELLDEEVRR